MFEEEKGKIDINASYQEGQGTGIQFSEVSKGQNLNVGEENKREDQSSPVIRAPKSEPKKMLLAGLIILVAIIAMVAIAVFMLKSQFDSVDDEQGRNKNVIEAKDEALEQLRKQRESEGIVNINIGDEHLYRERFDIIDQQLKDLLDIFSNSDVSVVIRNLDQLKQEHIKLKRDYEELNDIIISLEDMLKNLQISLPQISRPISDTRQPEPLEPPEPPSTSSTTVFNQVNKYIAERKTDADMLAAEKAKMNEDEKYLFDTRPGIPMASSISALLITKIVSTQNLENFYVQAKTTEPFEIESGIYLPENTVFYGKAFADHESRRLGVNLEGFRVGHIQISCKGVLLDKRGAPGLVSKYVDPFYWNLWLSLIPYAAAYALADDAQSITVAYEDGRISTTSSERDGILKSAASSTSNAIVSHGRNKRPVIIMKENEPVRVQINEKIPLDILLKSGAIQTRDIRRFRRDNPFVPIREDRISVVGGEIKRW